VQSDVRYMTAGTLQLHVAQRLPEGYTGLSLDSRAQVAEVARLMPDFAQVMQEYSSRANISMAHADCGESCKTSVKVKVSHCSANSHGSRENRALASSHHATPKTLSRRS
jgi:radical SAM superfamily enzyme with C-terminal helix-hairpin-helix motif